MVFARTYTYTFEEFRNKDLIKEMNKVENLLNHIKKHRKLYDKLVCGVCGQVGINHLHAILYSKIGHLENWKQEYSCQWVCD